MAMSVNKRATATKAAGGKGASGGARVGAVGEVGGGVGGVAPQPLNRSLHAAKATRQDEFYTQLPDVVKELKHYTKHFKGKTVLCNCDDPKVSNIFRYFAGKFHDLKLKRHITTCYRNADPDLFNQHEGEARHRRSMRLVVTHAKCVQKDEET